jgi:hypothetical protein
MKRLVDVTGCRWPVADGLFCDKPCRSPYCDEHRAVAYLPPIDPRKDPLMRWLRKRPQSEN